MGYAHPSDINYGSSGKLDEEKLSPLLLLKYNPITDAKREPDNITTIRNIFIGFQTHLYGYNIAV